ncbi:chorismate lyase [Methylotenera sp.]|uniref:chorismate--pyruvate lyase family protein n=1 Tax=Methylotenera sp. TaxID=2051956 RepID=UPI0024897CDE|nr:chorismate lyase [Methylotenera sp.]MDI1360590.1 chorismate lyase [Methylotenera sp.]
MKIQKNLSSTRQRWLNRPIQAYKLQLWLIDNGSLTARLQQRFNKFAVEAIEVKYAKIIQDETALLRQPNYQYALIREVLLMGNNQAVVFAHSVLPRASLRGAWNGLGRLGNKPLGATLFANPKVKRTALSYKKLTPNHALYQHTTRHLAQEPDVRKLGYLWARRSIFSLSCANIMVTEVFLPQLLIEDLDKN